MYQQQQQRPPNNQQSTSSSSYYSNYSHNPQQLQSLQMNDSFQRYSPSIQNNNNNNNVNGGGNNSYNSMQTLLNQQDNFSVNNGNNGNGNGNNNNNNSVGDDEYNRLLKNYKLAHERIEEQRVQMLEQEKQNAILRKHIGLLEGGDAGASVIESRGTNGCGGSTVDDFTIRNSSSGLERRINRWAADTVALFTRSSPAPSPGGTLPSPHLSLIPLAEALYSDLENAQDSPFLNALNENGFNYIGLGLVVQSLMRHVMSQMLSEGIVNELLVTNSEEANRELTKLHEQLFDREPLVASVWRRQTFTAAVDSLNPTMSSSLFSDHMPKLFSLINPSSIYANNLSPSLSAVLEASYTFSRMLHASKSPTGGGGMESSGFYRAYVPEIGSQLDPTKLELIKKCYRTERGEPERVGACLFPGLVKVSAVDTAPAPVQSIRVGGTNSVSPKKIRETRVVVVRRAAVVCECALMKYVDEGNV